MLGNLLLNVFDGDAAISGAQRIAQDILRRFQAELAAHQVGMSN